MDIPLKELFVLILVFWFVTCYTPCTPTPEKDLQGHPLPDVWHYTKNQYDAVVEANFRHKNKTVSVSETYFGDQKVGWLEILHNGGYLDVYSDYGSKQMFLVKDDMCKVFSVTDNTLPKVWGWTDHIDEDAVYGPISLFRLAKYMKLVYKGKIESLPEAPRGVAVDHWSTCTDDNVEVHFYFAVKDWNSPLGQGIGDLGLAMPIRVETKGVGLDWFDPKAEEMEYDIYYDFLWFETKLRSYFLEEIKVPRGLDCPGRNHVSGKPDLPNIPSQFSVSLEWVKDYMTEDPESTTPVVFQVVDELFMFYDKDVKVVRFDYTTLDEERKPMKVVQDFNTGVAYEVDTTTGDCVIKTAQDDSVQQYTVGQGFLGTFFKGPNSVFHLDDTYVYGGQYDTRGLETFMWTSRRTDIPDGNGGTYDLAVVDFYFSAYVAGEIEGTAMKWGVPVSIVITPYDSSDTETHKRLKSTATDFFHWMSFDANVQAMIDVRECIPNPTQRHYFRLVFPGNYYNAVKDNENAFKDEVFNLLTFHTGASPVRFPEFMLGHDDHNVYITGLLLERIPYLKEFKKEEGNYFPGQDDVKVAVAVGTLEDCAKLCVERQDFLCQSFNLCGVKCYLSHDTDQQGETMNEVKNCIHYRKAVQTATSREQDNAWVLKKLQKVVQSGDFNVFLKEKQEKVANFTASVLEDNVVPLDETESSMFADNYYMVITGRRMAEKLSNAVVNGDTYQECLAECAEKKAFECKSFAYCSNSKKCYLSEKNAETENSHEALVIQHDCILYGKNHMKGFESVPGEITIGTVQRVIKNVPKSTLCAYLCDVETEFKCKSFEFCPKRKWCGLHSSHYIDAVKLDDILENTGCFHWSRNFLVDFKVSNDVIIRGKNDRIIQGISNVECAKLCVEAPGFDCKSFDFCYFNNTMTWCMLSSVHSTNTGVEILGHPKCDHYSREYYDGKDRYEYFGREQSGSGYTSGEMAGLGIAMLLLAVVATLAGYVALKKFR